MVVAYRHNPQRYPCPRALTLSRQLGEHRLIVPGGVWDQPVGDWQAQQYAGYLWYVLDQEADATADYPIEKRLNEPDLALLFEVIRPYRKQLMRDG